MLSTVLSLLVQLLSYAKGAKGVTGKLGEGLTEERMLGPSLKCVDSYRWPGRRRPSRQGMRVPGDEGRMSVSSRLIAGTRALGSRGERSKDKGGH